VLIALLACVANAAPADNAVQLAGLFMQSCVQFSGDRNALRDWARGTGLAELQEPGRTAFLHDSSGVVFDASNQAGKFVLISDDAGGCSAVAETADGPALRAALEADLRQAGIGFTPGRDADDPEERHLRHREYTASLGTRTWRIVVGTVRDRQGGQAMLTANP
jgi:hypothetical protein